MKQRLGQWIVRSWHWLVALATLALLLVWGGYLRLVRGQPWADWTGFEEKTLWDWMGLLVVPAVLAIGAYFFSRTERMAEREAADKRAKTERDIARDQARDVALQSYFDRMTELMVERKLRESAPQDGVRVIARAKTLTTLDQLDGLRRALLLRFLYEAELIKLDDPVVAMRGASLSNTILHNVDLSECDLSAVNLREAQLMIMDMEKAKLVRVDLAEANLAVVGMKGVDLREANLVGANLVMVDLRDADLRGTVMKGIDPKARSFAEVERSSPVMAELTQVKLRGAKYDSETKWPDGFDPVGAGAIRVER
jgi:hypothetical protein